MKPRLRTIILFVLIPMLILLTVLQAWRVHNSIHGVILEGFDRKLMAAGHATAYRIDGDLHQKYQTLPPEADLEAEDFSHYFDPEELFFTDHREVLRELREAIGLTYLYTQIYLGNGKIFYLLDGTEGEDWAPPGTGDTVPDDSLIGIRDVQAFGIPWVTGILDWDVWGLIKAAYIPIQNSSGETVAMVGADVDITIIRSKTRQALFLVLLIGALTIAISLLMAFRIAGALTRPIEQIRYAALSLAAGNPEESALKGGIKEVKLLAKSLESLSHKLDQQEKEALALQAQLEQARRDNRNTPGGESLPESNAPKVDSSRSDEDFALRRLFVLNRTAPFSSLPPVELLILAKTCTERVYPKNKILCPAGYVPEFLFIPFRGKIVDTENDQTEGLPGVYSIYTGTPLTSSILAGPEGCEALIIPRGKFLTLIHERPDLLPLLLDQPLEKIS